MNNNEFLLPDGWNIETVSAQFADHFELQSIDCPKSSYVLLDSFDWRLYQANLMLTLQNSGGRRRLHLADWRSGETIVTLDRRKYPDFVWDLPSGRLRDLLQPVLEMRRLLPQHQGQLHVHGLRLMDNEDKTRVRVFLEQLEWSHDGGGRGECLPRLRLECLKGYQSSCDKARQCLEQKQLLREPEQPAQQEALLASGVVPGGYSSKINVRLQPNEKTSAAAGKIFLSLLAIIQQNLQGTLDDLDSEFLHDFRVAIRRTRSALTQIKGVLPMEDLEYFKAEFAWLQQVTGPTRDMDVYLLSYDDCHNGVPPVLQEYLEPFKGFIVRHQRIEQKRLVKALKSKRYRELLEAWSGYWTGKRRFDPKLSPNAGRSVQQVSSERIWKMYRRVVSEGTAVTDSSHPEELHELRKSCKKLRYLMEFFQDLYPADEIGTLIKTMKKLLDNLGNFQDFEVQAEKLRHFAAQMMQEDHVTADTLIAMGVLVGDLLERQVQARQEFAGCFADFLKPENGEMFRSLFRKKEKTA